MPKKPGTPAYRRHRRSGQGIVTLTDAVTGERRDFYLGAHGTPASKAEYKRCVLEWEANDRRLPAEEATADLTIAELIDRYWQHVESYYRHPDGTPTGEVNCFTYALRPLNYLQGVMAVKDFGPMALKTVREIMITGYEHPEYGPQPPICRTQINGRVKRIRRMFKWGVENEFVSASVLNGLQAIAALKRGRSPAKEAEPVLPIARAVVEDTLPILRPMVADMVRVQLEAPDMRRRRHRPRVSARWRANPSHRHYPPYRRQTSPGQAAQFGKSGNCTIRRRRKCRVFRVRDRAPLRHSWKCAASTEGIVCCIAFAGRVYFSPSPSAAACRSDCCCWRARPARRPAAGAMAATAEEPLAAPPELGPRLALAEQACRAKMEGQPALAAVAVALERLAETAERVVVLSRALLGRVR